MPDDRETVSSLVQLARKYAKPALAGTGIFIFANLLTKSSPQWATIWTGIAVFGVTSFVQAAYLHIMSSREIERVRVQLAEGVEQNQGEITKVATGVRGLLHSIPQHVSTHRNSDRANSALLQYIESLGAPLEVQMIQYSGDASKNLIGELISEHGASVTVLLQSPDSPVLEWSSKQKDDRLKEAAGRIMQHVDEELGLRHRKPGAKLVIRTYRVPASVSGIKVNDEALLLSWYVYDPDTRKLAATRWARDGFNILGSPVPTLVCYAPTPEYVTLARGVFDRTYCSLLEHDGACEWVWDIGAGAPQPVGTPLQPAPEANLPCAPAAGPDEFPPED